MADAFGLAASAAGIVSLGLQVYTGISSYVEGIKDRKTDLSSVTRQANTLQTAVNALQDAVPRINAALSSNESPLVPALKTVEEELWALRLFLGALQEQKVLDQTPDFATTLKEQRKKFTFPFHRPTLEKLQKKLESANSALQTSLHVVDLTVTTSMITNISNVHTMVDNSQSILVDTRSSVQSLESSMSSMALNLVPTQASIVSIEGKLDSLMMNESLEMNLRSLDANVGHLSEEMQQALKAVPRSTATLLTEVMDQKLAEMISRLSTESNTSRNINQGQLVMGRLLSKPSELKDACDLNPALVAHPPRKGPFPQRTHRSCNCHTRTVKYHQAKKFGDFFSVKKGTIQRQHLPGCELEAYDRDSTMHVRGIAYTGLRWILSRSVELSVSWTSGAGGSSISPSMTLRPMVDETQSPAFRIINLLSNNLLHVRGKYSGQHMLKHMDQILDHSANAILRSYRGNRCSFYDVNQHGESVLYKWMTLLNEVYKLIFYRASSSEISQFPIAAEVSVRRLTLERLTGSLSDYTGVSSVVPVANDYAGSHYFAILATVLEVLFAYDNDLLEQTRASIHKTPLDYTISIQRFETILKKSERLTHVLGIGPLSQSIINKNPSTMHSLLKSDPSLLAEVNYASQTPFHLAADTCNLEALKVLIKAARGLSTQFDTPDMSGNHALDVALLSSYSGSHEQNIHSCAHCRSCVSFDMFQSAGWQLSPTAVFFPCYLLSGACDVIQIRLISTIKQAREELQATARTYLSAYERQHFQLDSQQILDAHAHDVVKKLIESDINLPQGYQTMIQSGDIVSGTTVYHDLCENASGGDKSAELADLLYRSGFTDFDHEDANGHTPLDILIEENEILQSSTLLLWFLQHGANVSRAMRDNSTDELPVRGLRGAHRILGFEATGKLDSVDCSTMAQVIRMIAPLQTYDECSCGCVEAGCTTTTILFRSLWNTCFVEKKESLFGYSFGDEARFSFLELVPFLGEYFDYSTTEESLDSEDEETNVENVLSAGDTIDEKSSQTSSEDDNYQTVLRVCAYWFADFLLELQVDFAQWDHVCAGALRFLTFEALGIRHTCHCRQGKETGPPCQHYSEEVIREMQEEDHDSLHLLDELIEEFTEELKVSGDTFERFLTGYWADRVGEVLEDLKMSKMSPEQVRAAEDVGIIWDDDLVSASQGQRSNRLTLSERLEALIGEIDEIVAESM